MHINYIEKIPTKKTRELYDLYLEQWWTTGRSYKQFIHMIDNSDITVACYSSDDELVGFARVLTDYIFKAIIFDVIVTEKYQGNDIGTMIMKYVMAHKKLERVKDFELFCPERITPFYEKLGFEICQSKFMQFKRDVIV